MKLRFKSRIPRILGVQAVVLYPYILFSREKMWYMFHHLQIVKHEYIHVEQIRRMGRLRFYLTYIATYLKLLVTGMDTWYDHPLEQEAIMRQGEPMTRQEMETLNES